MKNVYSAAQYPIHLIQTGLYTPGGEYIVWADGHADYVGQYHILPNGQAWSGQVPSGGSKYLSKKTYEYTDSVKTYKSIRFASDSTYTSPVNYQPIPTQQDYIRGYINRCFVQKRNNPLVTIMEISPQQFNSISYDSETGINGVLYNSVQIKWLITSSIAKTLNSQSIAAAEKNFPGLEKYLTNPLEFSL